MIDSAYIALPKGCASILAVEIISITEKVKCKYRVNV